RDLVFLFERGISADEVLQSARKGGGKQLKDVRIFDLYAGKGVPEGQVSLGVRFTLQDAKRTLTQEDSDAASQGIIAIMEKKFTARLRG
ncbi:MAG: phenylalanine--tRNA ligase subunit beta, partial [Ghiorsea sp.]